MSNFKITDQYFASGGYGFICRNIMTNHLISSGAKGVYAYLCSYAGSDAVAFISHDRMQQEMNLSRNTLLKYINELKDAKVIKVKRKRSAKSGEFGVNHYQIFWDNESVNKRAEKASLKKKDSEKSALSIKGMFKSQQVPEFPPPPIQHP